MTIAFIPVRGGSKSIPLKNIKIFCGKPLVYWSIKALHDSVSIDKIVIATDSSDIKKIVRNFGFSKVEIYNRRPENAVDTASTESVMLEYIDAVQLDNDTVFMLVQATSPLTQTEHFEGGLNLYRSGTYDSILTCVRNFRFFWNDNGTPQNYDYRNRPRRQNFNGIFMENGAFYINSVKNIKNYKNRLFGRIGIYEMPEYTATEIDEPDDWIFLENLMYKYVLKQNKKDFSKIKLFLSDVDGVLTDGGMYYAESGDELKKFNTRDGMAFQLLREHGIKIGIITSENTNIVANRAKKLNLDFCIQGKHSGGKLTTAKEICNELQITLDEVAYIGDDINCKELLSNVGFAFCPNDAQKEVKSINKINIMSKKGGEGIIREVTDIILG
jgi:3-deoxy-D-manno-octulosonate 8-phosphate phosphatase, yrbI family